MSSYTILLVKVTSQSFLRKCSPMTTKKRTLWFFSTVSMLQKVIYLQVAPCTCLILICSFFCYTSVRLFHSYQHSIHEKRQICVKLILHHVTKQLIQVVSKLYQGFILLLVVTKQEDFLVNQKHFGGDNFTKPILIIWKLSENQIRYQFLVQRAKLSGKSFGRV